MSTSFEVILSKEIPTFEQVRHKTEQELHNFFSRYNIYARPKLSIEIYENNKKQSFSYEDRLFHKGNIWFCVDEKPFVLLTLFKFDDEDRDYWREDIIPKVEALELRTQCEKCIVAHNHEWIFWRSAGANQTTNLLYGLIAGSLASLGEGVIISEDSAWDYKLMPITGDDFLASYFRPEKDTDENIRSWSLQNISWLQDTYNHL